MFSIEDKKLVFNWLRQDDFFKDDTDEQTNNFIQQLVDEWVFDVVLKMAQKGEKVNMSLLCDLLRYD
ncbi:MAG: hypothetical protein IJJ61_03095 [Clostridia bacterium]|nr:hypothetical protein [Clostridia bacterium]